MRGGSPISCFAPSSSAHSETDPRKCASLVACDGKRRPLAKTGLSQRRDRSRTSKVDETRTRTSQSESNKKTNKEAEPPTQIHCAHTASTQHSKETRSWLHRPLGPPHASASRVGPAAQHAAGCAGDNGHGCAPSVLDVSNLSPASQHSKLALREGRGGERNSLSCVPACLPYWRWGEEHPPALTHARTHARPSGPIDLTGIQYDATPDLRFAAPDCRAGRAACLWRTETKLGGFCWLMRVDSGAVAVLVASAEEAFSGLVRLGDHSRRRGAVQGTRDDDTMRLPADC